jgi:alpha-ketoglutarate-dependent taurine dioxygenase
MATSVTPITSAIGVEVRGLSGGDFVDRGVADECLAALAQHGVVVYRGADIGDGDLVAFSRMLGEVVVAPMGGDATYPEISPITLDPAKSTLADYRRGTFFWHIDGVNDDIPQKATLLAAREVADEGGDTEFANTYTAYAALPGDEKAALDGVQVLHTFTAAQRLVHPDPTPSQLAAWARVPEKQHPLVWTRPDGRKSLLVGATTDHVVGMAPDESRALLDRLLEWATQPRFTLRHQWQRGDLVIWDNTGMLHRAQPYTAASRRLLHRTTLVGEQAVA